MRSVCSAFLAGFGAEIREGRRGARRSACAGWAGPGRKKPPVAYAVVQDVPLRLKVAGLAKVPL